MSLLHRSQATTHAAPRSGRNEPARGLRTFGADRRTKPLLQRTGERAAYRVRLPAGRLDHAPAWPPAPPAWCPRARAHTGRCVTALRLAGVFSAPRASAAAPSARVGALAAASSTWASLWELLASMPSASRPAIRDQEPNPRPCSRLRQRAFIEASVLARDTCSRTSPRARSAATTLPAAPPREPGSGRRLPSDRWAAVNCAHGALCAPLTALRIKCDRGGLKPPRRRVGVGTCIGAGVLGSTPMASRPAVVEQELHAAPLGAVTTSGSWRSTRQSTGSARSEAVRCSRGSPK